MSEGFESRDPSNSLFRVGDVVGNDYELLRELGRGGMGVVFEARHRFIDQLVALKVLYPHLLTEENWQRFVREARALGRLDHPGIVKIYNCGIDSVRAAPFYVMEVLKGDSLSDLVDERGSLDEELAVRAAMEAARALHFAHGMGVIHRDVKPSNFFLPNGEKRGSLNLKVLDFGIAALSSDRLSSKERQKLTATGQIFGTPYYMSPELVTGQTASPLSDQYSLGCTLFELLTGSVPYKGASVFETLGMHMSAPIPTLSEVGGRQFSSELEHLLGRAMAKNPSDRYASMQMVAVDLERYLDHRPVYGAGVRSAGFAESKQVEDSLDAEVTASAKKSKMPLALVLLCSVLSLFAVFHFIRPEKRSPQHVSSPSLVEDVAIGNHRTRQEEEALESRFSETKSMSPEDLRLIKSKYEKSRNADAVEYQFPGICIGEISTPLGRQPAQGKQSVPSKKKGRNDFVFFENVDRQYLLGLKPNSFDLELRFKNANDFALTAANLDGWDSLKGIQLDGLTIDEGIKKLDDLPRCRELYFKNCRLVYPLLESAQFKRAMLIVLKESNGPELVPALRALPKLENLRNLRLSALNLSADELDCLAGIEQLNSLTIEETQVGAEQLSTIMHLPHLEKLTIRDCLYQPSEILQALNGCSNRGNLELSLTEPNLPSSLSAKAQSLGLADRKGLHPWSAKDVAAIGTRVRKFVVLERRFVFDAAKGRFVETSDL